MSDGNNVTVGGGGLGTALLTGLFVWLKVEGRIDWSWWWVFAPIWIPLAFVLLVLAVIAIIAIIAD